MVPASVRSGVRIGCFSEGWGLYRGAARPKLETQRPIGGRVLETGQRPPLHKLRVWGQYCKLPSAARRPGFLPLQLHQTVITAFLVVVVVLVYLMGWGWEF